MEAELLPPGAPAWDAFLSAAEHDFYHLPAYVAMSAKADGGEPGALHVSEGPRRWLLPVVLRGIAEGARDATSPYGYPGPLVVAGDVAFARDALAAATELLAREGVVALFVRGHPVLGPGPPAGIGTLVEHGPTLSIDLTLSGEELWRRTTSGHRSEINKAARAGHRAFMDDGFEHLGAFAALYRATMQRVQATGYYFFSDEYFADLRSALGERLRLCVVEIGGEIAAGGLFVETGGLVQYHLSGTDARFLRERPTKLMLHFVRERARERGFKRLHLGGGVGSAEDTLFKFKAGFATDRHVFWTLRVVTDEEAYGALVRARHPTADPSDCCGFFPLYRK
jgi:CelD/BcsL family acetyltransferase involved in cellulose biosynthesis